MFDVVAMGELLIDFTPAGLSMAGNRLFESNPGGAPANVLVGVARLGGEGCFIGKVGDDQFGKYLSQVLEQNNVSIDGLVYSTEANTTLAFVQLDSNGDRSFGFYRKPGADMLMRFEEVRKEVLERTKVFHFGSVCLTDEPARSACMDAARYARRKGAWVSFDINWRPLLWENDISAKRCILEAIESCDILKVSELEMQFITGESDPERGSQLLIECGPSLVFVTLGPEGCLYRSRDGFKKVPTYRADVVDTTGAGDAFTAAILYQVTKTTLSLDHLKSETILQMVRFANAAGSVCVTQRGAIPAMPRIEEIFRYMSYETNTTS